MSVPFYEDVIYDVVFCNTFKACITLLFISWQVSAADIQRYSSDKKRLTNKFKVIFERSADINSVLFLIRIK